MIKYIEKIKKRIIRFRSSFLYFYFFNINTGTYEIEDPRHNATKIIMIKFFGKLIQILIASNRILLIYNNYCTNI